MTTLEWAVPGYTEVKDLGIGSQGHVILAQRDDDGELVAIKYLEPRLLRDANEAEMFRAEAHMLARLHNPNVAQLLSYAESENGAAIIMERISGITLRKVLDRSDDGISPQAALLILKGSLMGLSAAHAIGLVHRDYKPTNIMVQDGGCSKLIDFGIAVLSGGTGRAGTPAYMAPEQWRGDSASPATDIYAATCVFYECVTGHRPYVREITRPDRATSLEELHLSGPIPIGDIPRALHSIVVRGMAKRPEDRPPSADIFVIELEMAAIAAYGSDWERTGRAALTAAAAVVLVAGLPAIGPTALAALQSTTHTGLARLVRSKVTAGLTGTAVAGGAIVYLLYPTNTNPPPPALTLTQARQVLSNYVTTANKAGHDLDIPLLRTVETKPELDMDAAYFRFSAKHRLGPVKPTSIRSPEYWIPRIAGKGKRWFAVRTGPGSTAAWTWYTNAYIADDPGPGHTRTSANSTLVFAQQNDGSWKLALIVDPPVAGTTYPRPILDKQGYGQDVNPNATEYAMPPQAIPTAITGKQVDDLFGKGTCTNGPQTPNRASTPPAIQRTGWTSGYSAAPTPYPVYALKTKDAALVWFTTTTTTKLSRTNPRSTWTYALPYTGIKKAKAYFQKRLTVTRTATTVVINPVKVPGRVMQKPASLACGNATTSYTGN